MKGNNPKNQNNNLTNPVKGILRHSAKHMKEEIFDELQFAKSHNFNEKYSQIIDNIEYEKSKHLKQKKSKSSLRFKNKSNSVTICEYYDFIKEDPYSDLNIKSNRTIHESLYTYGVKKTNVYIDNSTIWQRSKEIKKVFTKNVEEKRNQLKEEEMAKMKSTPDMCKNTRRIIENKLTNEMPLSARYQIEIENNKNKVENLRRHLEEEKSNEYASNLNNRSKSYNKNSFEEWTNYNQVWLQNRDAKRVYLKKDLMEKEANDEDLVFRPKIDSNSKVIASKTSKNKAGQPIFENLYKLHQEKIKKIEKKKKAMQPSFTPQINKYPNRYTDAPNTARPNVYTGRYTPYSAVSKLNTARDPAYSSIEGLNSAILSKLNTARDPEYSSRTKSFYFEAESAKKNHPANVDKSPRINKTASLQNLNAFSLPSPNKTQSNQNLNQTTTPLIKIKTNHSSNCISPATSTKANIRRSNSMHDFLNSLGVKLHPGFTNLYQINVRTSSVCGDDVNLIKHHKFSQDIFDSTFKFGK